MKKAAALFFVFILATTGLKAFLIPVVDLGSYLAEAASFAEELAQIKNYIKLYQTLKHKLDLRVDKLKKGFKGLVAGELEKIGAYDEDVFEILEDSSYYAQYIKGSVLDRVVNGEKLVDIVKERFDLEAELKKRELYKDEEYKAYIDAYLEAYKEKITRLEDRIKFLNICKETGKKRLGVFEDRYELFEDVGEGDYSALGNKVGSEAKAISILSESMIDSALQDQEISILLRLKIEEEVSRDLNKIYLNNLKLITERKKTNE